jgi:Tol biopolymer transport system component
MAIRKLYLPAFIAAAMTVACSVALFAVSEEKAQAAFPGKNGRIAFSSDRGAGTERSIYTMDFGGKNVKRLTSDPVEGFSPVWAPGGKRIAYVVSRRIGRTNIYVMDADGSNKRLLTDETKIPGDGLNDYDPAFSPNGRTIVFARGRGYRDFDLYKVNVDGSGLTPVFEDARAADGPAWSPDGTKIAFHYSANRIATVKPNGTGLDTIGRGFNPDWSPDGTQLTFALDEGEAVESEIYKMNADGREVTQLTNPKRVPDPPIGAGGPVYSPGGGKITFYDGREGDAEIYKMNADGTEEVKLTQNGDSDQGPTWQPVQ